ncbi:MAG: hypothetical protein JXO22_09720, partial [Phycisphaerae bacterium]|nr:hypothetical protein [Phycisphaerae bacterium]
ARICTAALGGAAILVAVAWSDIIGLLLLTYHLWAPAIILPVCIGSLSKQRSVWLSTRVFITMLAAVLITLVYRGLSVAASKFDRHPLGESFTAYAAQIDASVVGVSASCIVFALLTVAGSMRHRKAG